MTAFPEPAATFEDQVAALRERAGAALRPDAVLRLAGADRADWLAGMVTNDTKALARGQSCYTAIVHVKGKFIADAWVHVRADDVLLLVPPRALAPLREHLERYVVMEDVELAVLSDARVVAVQGPAAQAAVGDVWPAAFAADRLGRGGVDLLVERAEELAALGDALSRGRIPVVGEAAWECARIEAGVPRFGADFDTDNFVQEANLQSRAVSTRKGCYVGQEVVCRLEVRGHVRKHLVSLVGDAGALAPGQRVLVNDADVGVVTSVARSPALGRDVALAMVKADATPVDAVVRAGGCAARVVARPVA
jgi:folate-binding protein YgfZ